MFHIIQSFLRDILMFILLCWLVTTDYSTEEGSYEGSPVTHTQMRVLTKVSLISSHPVTV